MNQLHFLESRKVRKKRALYWGGREWPAAAAVAFVVISHAHCGGWVSAQNPAPTGRWWSSPTFVIGHCQWQEEESGEGGYLLLLLLPGNNSLCVCVGKKVSSIKVSTTAAAAAAAPCVSPSPVHLLLLLRLETIFRERDEKNLSSAETSSRATHLMASAASCRLEGFAHDSPTADDDDINTQKTSSSSSFLFGCFNWIEFISTVHLYRWLRSSVVASRLPRR